MIQPVNDLVLIEPIEEPKTTASGLYIPEIAQGTPRKGKVLDVGLKVDEVPIGAVAHFQHYAGTEVRDTDYTSLLLVREEHIFAVEEGDNNVA